MSTSKLPPGLDRRPSGQVRARYRDSDGKQHSRTFPAKGGVRAAQGWLREQRLKVDLGTHDAASAGRITFGEYAAERVVQWREHEASTRAAVEGHMRNHILPTFGPMRLGAIRPSHVEDWVSVKAMELSPSTLHVAFAWLRSGEVLGLRRHRLDLLGRRGAEGRRKAPSILVAEQLQYLSVPPRSSLPRPSNLSDAYRSRPCSLMPLPPT